MEELNTPLPGFEGADTAAAVAGGVVGLVILLVGIAVMIFIMLTLQKHYQAISAEHREFNPPGKVWMLLIPLFNFYWMFIVNPGLGRSYRKALEAKGVTDAGDGGEKIGLWLAIASVAGLIPLVNMVSGIAALILLIMFLVKMADHKKPHNTEQSKSMNNIPKMPQSLDHLEFIMIHTFRFL